MPNYSATAPYPELVEFSHWKNVPLDGYSSLTHAFVGVTPVPKNHTPAKWGLDAMVRKFIGESKSHFTSGGVEFHVVERGVLDELLTAFFDMGIANRLQIIYLPGEQSTYFTEWWRGPVSSW